MSELDTLLIKYLSKNGPRTRGDISEGVGYARTTVFDTLKRLELCGVVKRDIKKRSQKQGVYYRYLPGRPYTLWSLIEQ